MRHKTVLLAAATLFVTAAAAHAVPVTGQISIVGYVEALGSTGMAAATGLDFVAGPTGSASPGVAGGITSFGGGTGSFAGMACANIGGSCGTIQDLLSFATAAPISSFLTLTTGATTISFDLATLTVTSRTPDPTGGTITLAATGLIHETGFDNTAGAFSLTTQGDLITSFSATTLASAVPEPASLAILGGSLAVVGLLHRKKT